MISIIIPIYNAEKTIERLFDSILNQSYTDYEVIAINDGSTDNTLEILNKYKDKCKLNIISITNSGPGKASNIGLENAKGEYVTFADSDDVLKKDYLKHLIDNSKDVTMVTSSIERIFDYKPNYLESHFTYNKTYNSKQTSFLKDPNIILEIHNASFAKLIKRQYLVDNNIYFPENTIYQDAVFTHQLISKNINICMLENKDYEYHVQKGSLMTSHNNNNHLFISMQKVYDLYQSYPNKEIINYYIFHHICIGGLYRTFKQNKKELFHFIKQTKQFLIKNDINIKSINCLNLLERIIANLYD